MLKKRLAGNFAANVFAQFANILVQLGSVPLFLAFWSKERYGEWLFISAIPSYLSLADAGFATFSANEVSIFVSKGERVKAKRTLHTAWGFLLGISSVIPLLTWAALSTVPWQRWLNITVIGNQEALGAVSLLCLYSVVGLMLGIYGTVYRGAYQYARSVYVTSTGRLLELGAMAICVTNSPSAVVLAGAMLGARVLTILAVDYDSRRFSTDLHLGLSSFSVEELKRTWRPATMFMPFLLGNALYFQGLTLLAGRMLGPIGVVLFNTTRTLTRVIVQFVTMIKNSVWPEFSYLFGAPDFEKSRRLNGLAFEVTWVAALSLAVLLYLFGPWLMGMWTHGNVVLDRSLLLLFLVSAVLNSLWFICSGLLMGANRHSGLAKWYLASTALSLVLAIPLVRGLGISGIAWAMILCELLLVPFTLKEACSVLEQPLGQFLRDAFCLRQCRMLLSRQLHWP